MLFGDVGMGGGGESGGPAGKTLGLNRCTPAYIVRFETKMDNIRVKTGRRAESYEVKIRKYQKKDNTKKMY